MLKLVCERSAFYRIKKGQTQKQISETLFTAGIGGVFDGKIIVLKEKFYPYTVKVGETYSSIAQKFALSEQFLMQANENCTIYPTVTIYVPQNNEPK